VVGLIVGVLGIGLSIYFYTESKMYRELTYYVYPIKTSIFRKGESSKLDILVDNERRDSDITGVQISIWNRGNQSIRENDLLLPIRILTKPQVEIIDFKTTHKSRDVIGFSHDSDREFGEIFLNWRILERNDGISVQIIHLGDENIQFLVDGVIEGQKSISGLESPNRTKDFFKWIGMGCLSFGSVLLFIIIPSLRGERIEIRDSYKTKKKLYEKTHTDHLETEEYQNIIREEEMRLKERNLFYIKRLILSFFLLMIGIIFYLYIGDPQPPLGF